MKHPTGILTRIELTEQFEITEYLWIFSIPIQKYNLNLLFFLRCCFMAAIGLYNFFFIQV